MKLSRIATLCATILFSAQSLAQDKLDILQIFDQFLLANHAAIKCIKPEPETLARFLLNFQVVSIRAAQEIQKRNPNFTNQDAQEFMKTRSDFQDQRVKEIIQASGCNDYRIQDLLKRFQMQADMSVITSDEMVKEKPIVPLHDEKNSGPTSAIAQFIITDENIEAMKPTRIAIASITPTKTGAKIVAFTNMNGAVSTFMRQMQQAGAASVTLHQLRPITACGKQLSRVEIEIYGDNSRLVAHNSQNEHVDITLDVNSVSSEKFKCTVPVGQ